jgi:hypothetical protein
VLGKAKVVGAYDANKTTTMTLYNSSMTVRGTAAVTGAPADGTFSGKFRNSHSTAVTVRPGDYVQSTIASDASFTVPDISVTADVDTDVVNGRCGDGSGMDNVLVGLYRSGDRQGWANWSLEPDGTFSFWFADENDFYIQPADVMHGDNLVVTCERTSGDEIETSWIVP